MFRVAEPSELEALYCLIKDTRSRKLPGYSNTDVAICIFTGEINNRAKLDSNA